MEDKLLIAVVAAVGTLVGAIVGAIASLGGAYLNNRTAWKIKKETMLAERGEQRRAFQRETLLQLQNEVGRYVELFAQSFGGADREKSREFVNTGANVMRLAQRSTDGSLRNEVINFLDYVVGVHAASCEAQEDGSVFERMQDGVAAHHNDLGIAIGEVLRTQL